jgi:hypothetical protein
MSLTNANASSSTPGKASCSAQQMRPRGRAEEKAKKKRLVEFPHLMACDLLNGSKIPTLQALAISGVSHH